MGKEISSPRVHVSNARHFYKRIEGREALANSNRRSTTRVEMSNATESDEGQDELGTQRENTTRVKRSNATRE